MLKRAVKIFLYFIIGMAFLAVTAFLIVFQEFGPVALDDFTQRKIREVNLVADFIYPKSGKDLTVVIALNGSGGRYWIKTTILPVFCDKKQSRASRF